MSSRATTVILALSGAVLTLVGLFGLVAPVPFHEANGIEGTGVALLNETRGTGGGLFGAGLIVLAGAVRRRLATTAALIGATVYLGYGLGRLVSVAVDGSPGGGLLVAAAVEITLGLACLLPLVTLRSAPQEAAHLAQ